MALCEALLASICKIWDHVEVAAVDRFLARTAQRFLSLRSLLRWVTSKFTITPPDYRSHRYYIKNLSSQRINGWYASITFFSAPLQLRDAPPRSATPCPLQGRLMILKHDAIRGTVIADSVQGCVLTRRLSKMQQAATVVNSIE